MAPTSESALEDVSTQIIRGFVRSLDGEGVAATIKVAPGGKTVAAPADGTFELELAPGRYSLEASASGYISTSREILVTDAPFIINIVLRPIGTERTAPTPTRGAQQPAPPHRFVGKLSWVRKNELRLELLGSGRLRYETLGNTSRVRIGRIGQKPTERAFEALLAMERYFVEHRCNWRGRTDGNLHYEVSLGDGTNFHTGPWMPADCLPAGLLQVMRELTARGQGLPLAASTWRVQAAPYRPIANAQLREYEQFPKGLPTPRFFAFAVTLGPNGECLEASHAEKRAAR